jgi:hypothetical protein
MVGDFGVTPGGVSVGANQYHMARPVTTVSVTRDKAVQRGMKFVSRR